MPPDCSIYMHNSTDQAVLIGCWLQPCYKNRKTSHAAPSFTYRLHKYVSISYSSACYSPWEEYKLSKAPQVTSVDFWAEVGWAEMGITLRWAHHTHHITHQKDQSLTLKSWQGCISADHAFASWNSLSKYLIFRPKIHTKRKADAGASRQPVLSPLS